MLGYAKFMKHLVTRNKSMDFEAMEVSHYYSAITSSNLVIKKEDLCVFTIPCTIKFYQFFEVLCDLGKVLILCLYVVMFPHINITFLKPLYPCYNMKIFIGWMVFVSDISLEIN